MKRIEKDCCGCATESYRCMGEHCSISVPHYYCDNCGDEVESNELFKWNDGEDWCKDCIINDVESDLEKAYPLD